MQVTWLPEISSLQVTRQMESTNASGREVDPIMTWATAKIYQLTIYRLNVQSDEQQSDIISNQPRSNKNALATSPPRTHFPKSLWLKVSGPYSRQRLDGRQNPELISFLGVSPNNSFKLQITMCPATVRTFHQDNCDCSLQY